jgi:hypothetical protein
MKQRLFVCFVLYPWDPLNGDVSDRVLGLFGKLSRRRGAWAWFCGVWTCGAKVLEYWMISSLKIKLNPSWKFQRNWNVPLVFGKDLDEQDLMEFYLVRFGFRMWEILIFKWFLPLKIQINSKMPRFWKGKSVEDMVTLGPTAQATPVMIGSGSFLLVVSHLFGVPVLVLWVPSWKKLSNWTWMWEIFLQGHILSTVGDPLEFPFGEGNLKSLGHEWIMALSSLPHLPKFGSNFYQNFQPCKLWIQPLIL